MRFRTLFLFVVIGLTVLFALLNWPAFTEPATLSLVFGTVQAPVGVIMLCVTFLLGAMCLAYLIYIQGTALLDARRHTKELQAQRDLVDKAEASRFMELHTFVADEMKAQAQMHADMRAQLMARLELLEQHTRVAMQETGNSLSAYIGELEDRLEHRHGNGLPGDPTAH
ncbi:LapA family protein [Piscinibacter terrae]|uniref:LapA family protein n=1 Tax=Piscinibacter terrae TaxID=2496871 RepID=A0A3N7HQ67_9BURK|nr:LapA family protein [Albitalea terrae]RQP24324.1 LapA family protein [Albitalea terrae]